MALDVSAQSVDRVCSGFPVIHGLTSPVHIIGHGRSGTSIFSAFCRVYLGIGIGTESQFIIRYQKHNRRLKRFAALPNDKHLKELVEAILSERYFKRTQKFGVSISADAILGKVVDRTYRGLLDTIFSEVANQMGYCRWGDKSPEYVNHLPAILQLFPNAQFIHIIRDGRDVALSAFEKPLSGIKNIHRAASDWRDAVAKVQAFERIVPSGNLLTVKYETLLDNPRSVFRSIIEFLKIEDESGELLNFVESQVKQELMVGNHTKWKKRMSLRQIRLFDQIAGDLLAAHGYETTTTNRNEPTPVAAMVGNAGNTLCQWTYPQYWALNFQRAMVRLKDVMP